MHILGGHASQVRSVAVAANGALALSGSADRTVRHWNLEVPADEAPVNSHSHAVSLLAIAADGKRAISGSQTGALAIWNADLDRITGVLSEADGHADALSSLRMSADGQTAVTASLDKSLRVWDLSTGRAVHVLTGHSRSVRSLQTSADHTRAVSLSRDHTVRLWDLVKGRQLRELVANDSERGAAGRRTGSALLSEMGVGPVVDMANFPITSDAQVAIAPAGTSVVYGSYSRLCCWDVETGATRCEDVEDFDVVAISIDARSRLAVLGSRFGRLRVWDMLEGKTVGILEGHAAEILDVVIPPNGESVVTAARDDTIRVWDLRTGKERGLLSGRAGSADAIAIAPNGAYAYAIYGDTIMGFGIARGVRIGSLSLDHQISALAVTPNGEQAAVGDQSGRVHFLRIEP